MIIDFDSTCPRCGDRQDKITKFDVDPAERPAAGHIVLCWNCGTFNIIACDGKTLRRPSWREACSIAADRSCTLVHARWRLVREERPVRGH